MFVKYLILSEHPRNCSGNDCHKYCYSSAVLLIILEAPVLLTLQLDSTTPPHPQKWNGEGAAASLRKNQKGIHTCRDPALYRGLLDIT